MLQENQKVPKFAPNLSSRLEIFNRRLTNEAIILFLINPPPKHPTSQFSTSSSLDRITHPDSLDAEPIYISNNSSTSLINAESTIIEFFSPNETREDQETLDHHELTRNEEVVLASRREYSHYHPVPV